MNKKVSVIAIRHPLIPTLFLHGLRRDNNKWSLAGGNGNDGETSLETAHRELKEETGIDLKRLENVRNGSYPIPEKAPDKVDVSLFLADCPSDLNVDSYNDPDGEFCRFKFLNPQIHDNMHIPADRNILVEHMNNITKNESILHPEYTVKCHICDKFHANPVKSNIALTVHDKKGNKIARAYFMHRDKGLSVHNLEIADGHDHHHILGLLKHHAESLTGKKLISNPSK